MKIGIVSPFLPHDMVDLLDSESKMRLAQIKGVPAPSVSILVRACHEMGHIICVFCLDASISKPEILQGDRIVIHIIPKRRARKCFLDFYRRERDLLREQILREQPDVLSAQWSYEHALAALDCEIPTVVTCHDSPLRCALLSKSFFMWYHVLVAARVLHKARHLIAVSPYTALHLEKYFHLNTKPIVIPNGFSDDMFQRGALRLSQGRTPGYPFTICSIGNFGRIKNLKPLLKAFQLVKNDIGEARLVLFGADLGTGGPAEEWAMRMGIAEGLEFRGPQPREEILRFLSDEAHMMVHTSLVEAHSLVLVEAMGCGVCVIGGSHSGAVPWTLGHGEFGELCDVSDPAEIGKAILRLRKRVQDDPGFALRALNSARERFSIKDVATRHLDLFEEIIGSEP